LVYLLEAFFKVLDEEMRDRCDESKKGVYNIEYTISKDFYAPGVRRLKTTTPSNTSIVSL